MYQPLPFWQANTSAVSFRWIPWGFHAPAHRKPYGWIMLPGDWAFSWNLGADTEERVVWEFGPLCLTRPETPQEREEREEGEAIAAWEERELNRYTEWYY
jgi:hypothetical protein